MKKFLFLGLFVAATLVSCKQKEEAPMPEPDETQAPAPETATPEAGDTTAMPADTTAAQQ